MREIEFRGKLITTDEWVFGSFVRLEKDKQIGSALIFEDDDLDMDGHHMIQVCEKARWVQQRTIGQYTGLKDKNGVNIFEGDIVKRIIVHNGYSIICFVEYCDCSFVMRHKESLYTYETLKRLNEAVKDEIFQLEVIGNIHDNREMLEVSNE